MPKRPTQKEDDELIIEINERGDISFMSFELFDQFMQDDPRWKEYCAKQSARSRAGTAAKREDKERDDRVLLANVNAVRVKYPNLSTRKIAAYLLEKSGKIPPVADGDRRHPDHHAAIEALH